MIPMKSKEQKEYDKRVAEAVASQGTVKWIPDYFEVVFLIGANNDTGQVEVDKIAKFFVDSAAGGCSITEQRGYWKENEASLTIEKSVKVSVLCDSEVASKLLLQIDDLRRLTKQKSILAYFTSIPTLEARYIEPKKVSK